MSPTWIAGAQTLVNLLGFFPSHKQGIGSEMQQPGHEPLLIWMPEFHAVAVPAWPYVGPLVCLLIQPVGEDVAGFSLPSGSWGLYP